MYLKDIEINFQTGIMHENLLALDNPCVIVICNGKVRMSKLPTHGETKIITHQGKVKRVKWDIGEEF